MARIVCGIFDRTLQADAALEELKREGFQRRGRGLDAGRPGRMDPENACRGAGMAHSQRLGEPCGQRVAGLDVEHRQVLGGGIGGGGRLYPGGCRQGASWRSGLV